MFDINIKNIKKGKSFYNIFLIFGIFFLILFIGIFISSVTKINSLDATVLSNRVEIKSHVDSEGSTLYTPVYYYDVKGISYSCSSNSSSSINPGTKNKLVYYDTKNPSSCLTEDSKSINYFILIALIIPLVFIIVAVINMNKINKRIKAINELNNKGKLVKNLPYRLENTGMVVNNVPIQRPVVDYRLPTGTVITLMGDPRHDRKHCDADGMVDLIIDENNPDNYYIDFEINRLTGNLPEDYYQPTINNQSSTYNQTEYQNINNNQNNNF